LPSFEDCKEGAAETPEDIRAKLEVNKEEKCIFDER